MLVPYLHPSLGLAENPFSELLCLHPHVLPLTLIRYCFELYSSGSLNTGPVASCVSGALSRELAGAKL